MDNRAPGRFDAASTWGTSRWNSGRYGSDYRYARPSTRLDLALFRVPIAATGRYEVFAWWPSDPGYSASAPFRIVARDGVHWVRVDERRNGGGWRSLGSYSFAEGDDWIVGVSARTSAEGYVVADAIKVVFLEPSVRGAPTLGLGSRGDDVRALQQRLVRLTYLPSGADSGTFDVRTWHAVIAFQGWRGLVRDGLVGPLTRAALDLAGRPIPWDDLRRGLELDLSRQVLLLVNRGRTVRAFHVSSAASGYHTPRGRFHVYRRERWSWSTQYLVWLPYAVYFSEGHAIHGYNSVPAFPASHGCVRISMPDAPLVFSFAPLGTAIWIR